VFVSILVIAAVGALLYFVKRWQSLPESERAGFSRKALIYGGAAAILGLVVAGKAHWLMGVLVFKKLMGDESSSSANDSMAAAQKGMSKQEAADILGVAVDESQDGVRAAHKRLMQKIHPDRGGSDGKAD